jgi:REP element-mobilizing transposase RayT
VPRRPRDTAPGYHHVWVNATGHWAYFLDDVDRLAWVRLLVRTLDAYGWTCPAFCQMTSHVHLLLLLPDESLPIGMRELNREYSTHFNLRHGRVGAFLRKRYGSRRIHDGADLLATYAYVVLNPVSEGVCSQPEKWYWSSYRTTLGLSDDFTFVDASSVVAEAGGSFAALEAVVKSAARTRQKRPRPEPGSGRGRKGQERAFD